MGAGVQTPGPVNISGMGAGADPRAYQYLRSGGQEFLFSVNNLPELWVPCIANLLS